MDARGWVMMLATALPGCQQYEYRGDPQGPADVRVAANVEMVLEFGPDLVGQAHTGPFDAPKKFSDAVVFSNGLKTASGSSHMNVWLSSRESRVMAAAVFNALEGTEWEFMINPRYQIEVTDNVLFEPDLTCTVRGRAVRVSNYRQVSGSP